MTKLFKSMPFAGAAILAVSLSAGAAPVAAQRNGVIHIQKDCGDNDGGAGAHCTITASNLAELPATTIVYYDQPNGIPQGMLDSNVVLLAPDGSKAVGRCTVDHSTRSGLCTFSDGIGLLAGFTARVEVTFLGGTLFSWEGTYSFKPLPVR
jgi:hypothetical protein